MGAIELVMDDDELIAALAASSADRNPASSSMIRTCTGWIRPAASAANVAGSRVATVVA